VAARRVDANQREIVGALRQCGCSVHSLASVGNGCPDVIVGIRGENYLLEIKTDTGKLTPQQRGWLLNWRGQKAVVHDVESALAAVGIPPD
jgi:hypothetical protein